MTAERPLGGVRPTDLVARPAGENDFDACLDLLRGRLAYPSDILALLPQFWERLLREEAITTSIVEARDARGLPMVAGFGASVFATDEWIEQALATDEPYLTARTIRQELRGPSPVLRPAQIADANRDGLNVLILHYGEAPKLADQTRPALRYRMFEALIEALRGYQIEAVLQEFWDEIDPEFVIHGWGQVRSDYVAYFQRRGEPLPPEGRRPMLIGITRGEVEANPGAIAAPLFVHVPPRLGFTVAEKRLLRQAMLGQTDLELAETLGLSLSTVKSRWRSIYQRVHHGAPELMPDLSPAGKTRTARGQEKRRRLLGYLRRHPEELQPGLSRPR